MTIKVGTIQEMTGEGYELLVDAETRSMVLARFFDGKMVGVAPQAEVSSSGSGAGYMDEPTVITH